MATYLHRLRAQPAELLDTMAAGDRAERAVAQVWLMTLDRLCRDQPIASELLRLLSFISTNWPQNPTGDHVGIDLGVN